MGLCLIIVTMMPSFLPAFILITAIRLLPLLKLALSVFKFFLPIFSGARKGALFECPRAKDTGLKNKCLVNLLVDRIVIAANGCGLTRILDWRELGLSSQRIGKNAHDYAASESEGKGGNFNHG